MSRWGKRRDEGCPSGDGDSQRPNKKKAFNTDADDADDSDDIIVCEISRNRRVSVRNWQGKVVVDIREFYVKDGKEFPGKKGISLSMEQWEVLRNHVEEIDKAVDEN